MNSKTLPKPSSSNKQVQEYMAAVRKGMDSYFVVETREGWSVRPATEPSKAASFATKEDAIQNARAAAKAKHGEVLYLT
jgi:hypothetical protein